MKIDTNDIVSVSDASTKGVSWLVSEASAGRPKVLVKNSRPAAVVTDIETLGRLQDIDELAEDLRLLTIAVIRDVADTGRRFALDDVIEELGIEVGEDS